MIDRARRQFPGSCPVRSSGCVEPSYLAELALTNGIGRPLDFIPRFARPDPLLHEITAALTSAPRIKDPAANLFIETLVNAACARILRDLSGVRPQAFEERFQCAVDAAASDHDDDQGQARFFGALPACL